MASAGAAARQALVVNADGYDEVAARPKPSAEAAWDLPGGSLVDLVDEWVECKYELLRGFIKAKNLPGVETCVPGSKVDVRDSYKGNAETCMRRHAEQDASKGNVLCYVPNGEVVELIERWVECKWRGHKTFVKGRHVRPTEGLAIAGMTATA